ncbi:lysosome membrane protein 2-like isoform X1 [Pieris napi]|uniref:lysosome membrane protein 2-like isoform X1 n=1 Tax=Pieris napi TaxID=78633 RepID=UPI001FBB18CB|nr:lysosome membrane protein 2-like isoform X1 [Pieris napi]XP_047513583.1 lysosome membrane protein 2-like isoform X1 [Pieris napi]
MAEEVPTVNLDDTGSQAASTSVAGSNRDSLNSLLNKPNDNKNCLKDCTLGTRYSMICDDVRKETKRKSFCCNTTSQTVWGVILISLSISGFIFTPQDLMLWEKLNMRPGLPPYDWWSDPPDQVRMRMYVFNVTNHERFLSGADDKINVEEIGPIVYLEKLLHYNITFNDNGTMTYTAKRFLIYLPEENTINLNSTIIIPNLAVLGIASRIHNENFFIRGGFSIMVRTHSAELFAKKTIYQFMWDNQDSVLETTNALAHNMVPTTNMGVLFSIYTDFTDDVTVKIGPQWGHHNFFKIDQYGRKLQLKGYDLNTCPDTLTGSTEGVMYHQRLSKDDVLLYLRKSVCRAMPLSFDQEVIIDNVPVYRYNLSDHAFDRINGTDCYDSKPSLPNGFSDTSKCYDDLPMVASYPHFYTGHPPKDTYVTGLIPDKEKHNSYVLVEPLTGTPFRAVARMQCNFQVQNLSAFSDPNFHKFSNLIIPLSWIEYSQEGLPWYIKYFIYFLVVILPPLTTLLLTGTLILGFYFAVKQIYRKKCVRRKFVTKVFETEKFLKVTN